MSARNVRNHLRSLALAGLVVSGLATGCSPGPEARFELLRGEISPFPSDYFTRPANTPTGLLVDLSSVPRLPLLIGHQHVEDLDGFGTYSAVAFSFSKAIDPASLPAGPEESLNADSSIFLLKLDPSSRNQERVPVLTTLYNHGTVLSVRPYDPLDPKILYAVVITNALVGKGGNPVEPSDAFLPFRGEAELPDPAQEALRRKYRRLFDLLESAPPVFIPEEIPIATVFTTQSIPDDLAEIREQIVNAGTPTPYGLEAFEPLTEEGELNPEVANRLPPLPDALSIGPPGSDAPLDRISLVLFGRFDSPEYRADEPGEARSFRRDPVTGALVPQGVNALDFILTLPDEEACEPYPIVIFIHAITACKETHLAIANTFASFGMATIGIDLVGHASRYSGGGCFHCGETQSLEFLNPFDFLSTRDSFRQSVVDHMALVRMLKGLDAATIDFLPPDGGNGLCDIDTSRIISAGQSLGSSIEVVFTGVEPEVEASVINVGAGGVVYDFMGEAMNSSIPEDWQRQLAQNATHATFQFAQMIIDKSDPINFARHGFRTPLPGQADWAPKNILLQEAIHDDVVPNISTNNLARAFGVDLVMPVENQVEGIAVIPSPASGNISREITGGFFQFAPAQHTFLLLSKEIDRPELKERSQLQVSYFLRTFLDTGTGVIIDPYDEAQVPDAP